MRTIVGSLAGLVLWAWSGGVAEASPVGPGAGSPAFSAIDASPSSRAVQAAVDAYLDAGRAEVQLVGGGGGGGAGYDRGFWIGGGDFFLKINLVLQTRWEGFDWDDSAVEPSPGGDLSGFTLPHGAVVLHMNGPCDTRGFMVLDFGHFGPPSLNERFMGSFLDQSFATAPGGDPGSGSDLKEVWIEKTFRQEATLRMGHLKTATTRQAMTSVPFQQFVDISMATSYVSVLMPGYTERNRDNGLMLYGSFGDQGRLQYLATITNGDTPPGQFRRNVLDATTDDSFAYSARVNWDFKCSDDPESRLFSGMGYREGALLQRDCEWIGAVGAWGYAYADHLSDRPHVKFTDRLLYGVDLALGWGGFSLTAAASWASFGNSDVMAALPTNTLLDFEGFSWLAQVGYHFPGTAFEIAARVDGYTHDAGDRGEFGAVEVAGAVSYYIDGIRNKVTVDASFISAEDDGNLHADVMSGYSPTLTSDAVLVRFQWQLVL
jgi:hypothetical protein